MKSIIQELKSVINIKMFSIKKSFIMLALIVMAFAQNSFSQSNTKTQPVQLLNTYYKLKDALVSSNPVLAANSADELVKTINGADLQIMNDAEKAGLLKEAVAISQSKDIKLQREKFVTLSNNMFELAKKVKLSAEPIYQQYCPMKKAIWLSNNKAIKNPYFGSAMLSCGSIKATL